MRLFIISALLLATSMAQTVCEDDPNWTDSAYGDGTITCMELKNNPNLCHPANPFLGDNFYWRSEAWKACPVACEVCPMIDGVFYECVLTLGYNWYQSVSRMIAFNPAFIRSNLQICRLGVEFVLLAEDGTVYPTCLAFGAPETPCPSEDLVCPSHESDPSTISFGGIIGIRLGEVFETENYSHPDCPATTTDAPTYECGATIAECEAAFQTAKSATCEPTSGTGSAPVSVATIDSCDAADGWWVAGALDGLAGYDANTMSICQSNGQYVVQKDGKNYPTCVEYQAPQQNCVSTGTLVCPSAGEEDQQGIAGWSGSQKAVLSNVFSRSDFVHPDCVSSACTSFEQYWREVLTTNPYTTVTESQAYNVCVMSDNQVYVVTQDMLYPTCIGFSKEPFEECNSGEFLCAGHSGEGLFTYGWPGQIGRTLAKAVVSSSTNYQHPQCPINMCSA